MHPLLRSRFPKAGLSAPLEGQASSHAFAFVYWRVRAPIDGISESIHLFVLRAFLPAWAPQEEEPMVPAGMNSMNGRIQERMADEVPFCGLKSRYQFFLPDEWPQAEQQAWIMHINMIGSILSLMGAVERDVRWNSRT